MGTKNHKPIPNELTEWLEVDLTIPEGLRWKKDRYRAKKGAPAGCRAILSGIPYYVVKFKQKTYLSHRVIYFLTTGTDPGEKVIDHINSNKNNAEIRLATIQENLRYSRKRSDSKNKYKGVYYHKRDKLWAARITINSKTTVLGYFKTEEAAAQEYDRAARQHFKEFALTNFVDSSVEPDSIEQAGNPG
jgi:AP2 domain/HNH endonuclease